MVVLMGSACIPPADCVDTVLMESTSPDQSMVAVVFELDCGATAAENTQICLLRVGEKWDPERQASFSVFESEQRAQLCWRDSKTLLVTLPTERKVFRQEATASGVAVEYVTGDR
jgi:hypothetical protein